jgi:hypothetical protein
VLLVEVQRVQDANVEVVLFPRALERGQPLGLVGAADEVHPEIGPGLGVVGVDLHRLAHHGDDLVVTVLPFRELADDLEELRVLAVLREDSLFDARKSRGIVGQEAHGRLHRQKLEIARRDGEPPIEREVRAREVHGPKSEPRLHEKGPLDLGIDGEGLLDFGLRGRKIESLLELHQSHRHVRFGIVRSDAERLLDDLLGVAWIVLVEEEIRSIEQRPHEMAARPFCLVVGVVGVAGAPEQLRGAPHEREPLGVGLRDGVLVVVGDERHERLARLRASARGNQQLSQEDASTPGRRLGLHRLELRDGLRRLALAAQRFRVDRHGIRPHCAIGLRRSFGGLFGFRVPPRRELHLGQPDQRGAAGAPLGRRAEPLLGGPVIASLQRSERRFEPRLGGFWGLRARVG